MFEKRKMMKVKVKDLLEDLGTERTNRIKYQTECERKKNEIRVLKQNNEALERETRMLREKLQEAEGEAQVRLETYDELRHRIYTLLRSADQDMEIFGLPRITLQETGVQLHHESNKDELNKILSKARECVRENYKPESEAETNGGTGDGV